MGDYVVLTRGAEGAVLVSALGRWMAVPPPVELVSAVGRGDSFLAGLSVALERGAEAVEALHYAAAAGAANAQSLEDFNRLFAQTKAQILSSSQVLLTIRMLIIHPASAP